MTVVAIILDGPVTPDAEHSALQPYASLLAEAETNGEAGAAVRFEGIVRRMEADPEHGNTPRELAALEYQTYDPMAGRELESLAHAVAERYALKALVTLHSRGRIRVGEVSFVLQVWSAHRREALAAMSEFIDDLKQQVPIWKTAVWA